MVANDSQESKSAEEDRLWEAMREQIDARRARAKECADDMFVLLEYVAKAIAMRDWLGFDDVTPRFREEWGRIESYVRRNGGTGDPEAVGGQDAR